MNRRTWRALVAVMLVFYCADVWLIGWEFATATLALCLGFGYVLGRLERGR